MGGTDSNWFGHAHTACNRRSAPHRERGVGQHGHTELQGSSAPQLSKSEKCGPVQSPTERHRQTKKETSALPHLLASFDQTLPHGTRQPRALRSALTS